MCDCNCKLIKLFEKNHRYHSLYLQLPKTFNEYWESITNKARNQYRKCEKNNYKFKQIFITPINDIERIWGSWDYKQGRKINLRYNAIDDKIFNLNDWPIKDYSIYNCQDHNLTMYGGYKDNILCGHIELVNCEDTSIVHVVMGHKDDFKNDIMKFLFINAINTVIGKRKYFVYGTYDFLFDNRKHFIKDLLITNIIQHVR